MDFPGWLEAAGFGFFVFGMMEVLALKMIYSRTEQSMGLSIFFWFEAVGYLSFTLTGLFSPVLNPVKWVVVSHTVPYLMLQVSMIAWCIFLYMGLCGYGFAQLRPPKAHMGPARKIGMCCAAILVLLCYALYVAIVITTFALLYNSNVKDPITEESPAAPGKELITPAILGVIVGYEATLLLHPLSLWGQVDTETQVPVPHQGSGSGPCEVEQVTEASGVGSA